MRGGRTGGGRGRRGRAHTGTAVVFACACWLLAGPATRAAAPAFPQRAYIWQRAWTPAVAEAVEAHARAFAAIDVLAAEISFANDRVSTSVPEADWPRLARQRVPIGVVVRIGPRRDTGSSAQWAPERRETQAVIDTCRDRLATIGATGVRIAELELDFDAATARLRDYHALILHLRAALPGQRIVITALPTWINRDGWRELAAAVDAYVLQLHSLEKPTSAAAPLVLFDAAKARGWIAAAVTTGRPFRLALPCYGYRVAFAADGALLGLEAEGRHRAWPAGATLREMTADPAGLAGFMRSLLDQPPAKCEGVAWFRLPIATDARAWRWPTLHAVMTGTVPAPHLTLRARGASGGVVDLIFANDGTADATLSAVRIAWRGARLIAADGIAGFSVRRRGENAVLLASARTDGVTLAPGETACVGWLRLDHPASLTLAR